MTQGLARTPARCALLVAAVLLILAPAPASAQGKDQMSQNMARWKQEEDRCISQCPPFPRFSGLQTPAQYKARIKQENAYNACYNKCVRDYMHKVRPGYKPFDDGSDGYYQRNMDPYQQ